AAGDGRAGAASDDGRAGRAAPTGTGEVAERLRTLVALAHVLRSTGDLEACAARLGEALALVPDDDVSTRVRLIAARAAAQHFLGRHEQANRQLDAALDALEDRTSPDALTVLFARIAGAFFSLDVDEGCALGAEALAVAERLGDPLLIGASAAALAHAQANAGDAPAATKATDLAAARLDAADDHALAAHIEALNRLAWAEHLIERDADATRHAQRGIAIARATGQDQFVPMLTGAQALSLLRQGHVASALALQVDALETAKVAANDYVTCWVLSTTAHIAIARGNGDDARRDAELAVALVDGRDGRVPAMARARLAVIRRALGERPQGVEELLDALAPSWAAPYAEAVVRAELADGRVDAAEPFVVRVEAAAAQLQLPWAAALADRARAAWRLARGDAADAVTLALSSIAGTQFSPITTARTQVLAGRALAQDGRRAEAIAILRSAERTFDAIGIPHDRDLARRALRKLHARAEPRGPSAPGETGLASLSTREREVAELVTARHTNREIAALLFLGEKTIETHLRNIFVKLGVSSRVDVARAVERGT
ncbi:helix-turn-helix transcriptional regulator, partial [Solirubrobacter taibaiensis]|nr:helix-turn-helix transcriptional regulator [Solirubrobacter taibaiensis]